MNISSDLNGGMPEPSRVAVPKLTQELSRLSHNLMGSISALMMCEHMLSKELDGQETVESNPTVSTTLSLLKDTSEQLRSYGYELMDLSQSFKGGLRHSG